MSLCLGGESSSDSSPRSYASSSHADAILTALADPDASLNSVARQFNIPLAALTLWLSRPDIQARVRQMESGACTHTRLAASLNLSAAVRTLTRILDDFDALARTHTDPLTRATDPDYIRASERARRAAATLMRLARIIPIDETALARAARARAIEVASTSMSSESASRDAGPLPVNAPTPSASVSSGSSSFLSSQPVYPADALTHLPSSAFQQDSSSRPSRSESDAPQRASDSSAPSALSSPPSRLTDRIDSLAASFGVDMSDYDPDAPLPPECLALLPPDLAELLAPNPAEPQARAQPPTPLGASP